LQKNTKSKQKQMDIASSSQHAHHRTENIFDYIVTLGDTAIDKLYEHTWTCKAIFRYLPELARQYVLRLVLSDGQIALNKYAKKNQTTTYFLTYLLLFVF